MPWPNLSSIQPRNSFISFVPPIAFAAVLFIARFSDGRTNTPQTQFSALQNQTQGPNPDRRRESPPYWAYAVNPPKNAGNPEVEASKGELMQLPGSSAAFTANEIADLFHAVDWHPDGHPAMPDVVAHGRKPEVYACGYCHLPNGQGRPENSSLAGLPAEYILQQMADFKSGLRKSSEPRDLPVATMVANETKATETEIKEAARYFSELKPKMWIRVVEAERVPKTHVAGWMLVADEPVEYEAIGERIIEMPENLERTELRDDTSGFVAYVPPGSLKRGELLVNTGGDGRTIKCATCHGPELRGLKNVPSIAGRSPSYVVRQLYDIQNGTRAGVQSQLMKPVVEKLTMEDMISIAAYTSSLNP